MSAEIIPGLDEFPKEHEAVVIEIKERHGDMLIVNIRLRTNNNWILFKDRKAYVGGKIVIKDDTTDSDLTPQDVVIPRAVVDLAWNMYRSEAMK